MNKHTIQLVDKLADKLGTTAEHLWGVLVRQAPISAWTHVGVLGVLATASVALWWYHFRKIREDAERGYGWDSAPTVASFIFAVLLSAAFLVGVLAEADTIVAGLFSPEYWALRQILNR